jgi:hypothetical protein
MMTRVDDFRKDDQGRKARTPKKPKLLRGGAYLQRRISGLAILACKERN